MSSEIEERSSRRRPRAHNVELPKFDQEMRSAKNSGKVLRVYLPCPTSFTDQEDNSFDARVIIVDRFQIKFEIVGSKLCVWVPKQDLIVQEPSR